MIVMKLKQLIVSDNAGFHKLVYFSPLSNMLTTIYMISDED